MDKKVANNVVVGIFITLGFIGFVLVIFNIGDGKGIFSSQVSIFGRFDEVKGLHQGSEVTLNGLRIGVIKKISIATDEKRDLIIEFGITKSFIPQIKRNSVAMIRTQGMLGDKYVEITIGTDGEVLKDGDFISTHEAPDLLSKGGNAVESISRPFTKGGDVETLLKNLNHVAVNLAAITGQAQKENSVIHEIAYGKSGEKLNQALSHLESILNKIEKGEGTLGALVNDPGVYEDLKSLLGGAKRSGILRYFMKSFIDSGGKIEEEPKKDKPKGK